MIKKFSIFLTTLILAIVVAFPVFAESNFKKSEVVLFPKGETIDKDYFAWGEKQAELIRNRYPESSARIKVVGSHRLDIIRPEFQGIHMHEKNRLRQKYGRYILFSSNFSEILNVGGGREYQLWQREKQGALTTDENRKFYQGFLNHLETAIAEYIKILPRIRKEFPQHTLIVRPHPGDDPDYWIKVTQGMDKTVVIHEGNIIPWLLGTDAMFHHSCTTGLEAYLLGVPGIAYHPCYNPDYDSHLSTKVGPIARDENSCIDLLHRAINHMPLPREDISWLDNYLMRKNNELASDRMLNAIEKLDWPEERLYSLQNAFSYLLHNSMRSFFLTARKIKHGLKGEKPPITMGTRKWNYTTAEDVQSMIQVLQETTGRFQGVTARKLTGQIFCLYS